MGSIIKTYSVQLVKESSKRYDIENVIKSPSSAYEIVEEVLGLSKKTQEHFVLLSLNTKNQIIGIHTLHIGTVDMSVVHSRDVFQRAILNNATNIMVCHNHPSGNTEPSRQDIDMTKRLKQGSEILGINLLDHIIVGDDFTSMKEHGYC